jgi:hypothetical protein
MTQKPTLNNPVQLFLFSYRMVVRVSPHPITREIVRLMIALNQDLIMNTQANPNATAGQAASATSNDNFIDASLTRG